MCKGLTVPVERLRRILGDADASLVDSTASFIACKVESSDDGGGDHVPPSIFGVRVPCSALPPVAGRSSAGAKDMATQVASSAAATNDIRLVIPAPRIGAHVFSQLEPSLSQAPERQN